MTAVTKKVKLDQKKLLRIIQAMPARADKATNEVAHDVEAGAKMSAPVKTGALANSLHTLKISEGVYHVQDGVLYGIFQELGSHKMAAQPFLLPNVESRRGLFVNTLIRELKTI